MEFEYSPDDLAFRRQIRQFLADELPQDVSRRFKRGWRWTRAETEFWTKVLHARGWSAPNWPPQYGGTGWSPMKRYIFELESWLAGAPPTHNQNFDLVGPIVFTFGDEDLKRRILPPILSGDAFWAQGFSEPGAGSDLASLRTTAVRDGDHYVVDGQKLWTSDAEVCDGVFCLVRTDTSVKPQAGISFLLIDLKLPGITIRPIEMLNGERHLNEVFFDGVRVPMNCLVGEENKGWGYTKTLLAHERTASARVPELKRDLELLKQRARSVLVAGRALIDVPQFEDRLASLEIDITALEYTVLRVLSDSRQTPSMRAASVLKVRGSELLQQLSALMMEVLGLYSEVVYPPPQDWSEPWLDTLPGPEWASGILAAYLHRRAATIYGGSNEIQRTLIARAELGR
jgi:alkylation response protein AidB-like acyl-CoA dehydrogenase